MTIILYIRIKIDMKFFVISLLTIALFSCEKTPSSYNYEWKDISLYKNLALKTIYFLDNEIGYIGGASNIRIAQTINHFALGGFGDTLIYLPNNKLFYSEYIFEEDQVFSPVLYKTSNGGLNWHGINTPFKIGISNMQFIDENVGYVATIGEGVYKTTDGGISWDKLLENTIHYYNGLVISDPFNSVCFVDKNKGFVFGTNNNYGILFSTINGGQTWECLSIKYPQNIHGQYPTLFNDLNKVTFFNSSDTGYIVNNHDLYKTPDFGKNWEKIYSSESIRDQTVYFTSPQIGYLTYINLNTEDGGKTWFLNNFGLHGNNLILINQKEFYYLDNGSIRRELVGEDREYFMTTERDKYIIDLFFPSDNVGYAIGIEGTVLKYSRK